MNNDMKRYRNLIDYFNKRVNNIVLNEKLPYSILKNNDELDYFDEFKQYVYKLFKKNDQSPPELFSHNNWSILDNYIKEHGKILPDYAINNQSEAEAVLINLDFDEYGDVNAEKRAFDFYSYYDSLD
ncbi:hypothetical protein PBI_SCTP2_471 [Salicola phage SCTP-2]|nr:hypothetical protein PBI_SCTP2_471 [Salicola phage SCTP-2]